MRYGPMFESNWRLYAANPAESRNRRIASRNPTIWFQLGTLWDARLCFVDLPHADLLPREDLTQIDLASNRPTFSANGSASHA